MGVRRQSTVLWHVVFCGSLLFAAPALAETPEEVQRMIVQEAVVNRVPTALALALAKVESNFDERALSPVGARGVMQIMPKTAQDEFGVGAEYLWNARTNVRLGLKYLTQLYDMYGKRWDLALSHYNGGSLKGGTGADALPHDYTKQYVADVLRWQQVFAKNGFIAASVSAGSKRPLYNGPRYGAPRLGSVWQPGVRIDPLEFQAWAERARQQLTNRLAPEDRSIR